MSAKTKGHKLSVQFVHLGEEIAIEQKLLKFKLQLNDQNFIFFRFSGIFSIEARQPGKIQVVMRFFIWSHCDVRNRNVTSAVEYFHKQEARKFFFITVWVGSQRVVTSLRTKIADEIARLPML